MPTSNSEARKRASAKPVENVKTTEALNINPTPVMVEYADRFEPLANHRCYNRQAVADAYWEGWDAACQRFIEHTIGKGENPYVG